MLSAEGLHVSRGRTRVLFGVSLEVPAGSLVCVMGRNGVGKTTLLNTLMGVLTPTRGHVSFDGHDITRAKTHKRVRAGIGYVPQGHGVFPQLTVWENLAVVLEATKHGDAAAVDEALELFPRLKPMLKRKAGFLSGGQQQQLAIARALITRPRLLVLDEPTEGIQPSIIDEIEEAIAGLHAGGLSILLVEQYLDFALRLADSFVILERGEVVRTGSQADLHDESVRRLLAV
jgi:urea transport system ATP-binding protein